MRYSAYLFFALSLLGCASATASDFEDLNGVQGKVFRVDPVARQFDLLKETAFDPKTNEGRSRHIISWDRDTRFVRVDRQNNFKDLDGKRIALVRPLKKESDEATAIAGKRSIITLDVTFLAPGEDGSGFTPREGEILAPFEADPKDRHDREGILMLDGAEVPLRLRGPLARVGVRNNTDESAIASGFWTTHLHGAYQPDGSFVADRLDLYPAEDPCAGDDPVLPRVLVVGDSISMNYHSAAKAALEGIANYHRIEGNGGSSERGVVCMELWLGDYTQEGMGWDVIQFNHGLHDLKQWYDEDSGQYGAHMVPVDEYKKNLEQEIQIMKKTGARLVWCPTTPVPKDSVGRWKEGTMGRQKDEDLLYNRAALEVMERHPEIVINDINTYIRESDAFADWIQQKDVHFWDQKLQGLVGRSVADGLMGIVSPASRHRLHGSRFYSLKTYLAVLPGFDACRVQCHGATG